jgi:hypothetical protein
MEVEVKKENGIENLVRDYQPQDIEQGITIPENNQRELSPILTKLEKLMDRYPRIKLAANFSWDNYWTGYMRRNCEILTPDQISMTLTLSAVYEQHPEYRDTIGLFVRRYTQKSYEAGHNEFSLQPTGGEIALPHYLTATQEEPIFVDIQGDAGDLSGGASQGLHLMVYGNAADQFGWQSKNSWFDVRGSIGTEPAVETEECVFKFSDEQVATEVGKDYYYTNVVIYRKGEREIIKTLGHDFFQD